MPGRRRGWPGQPSRSPPRTLLSALTRPAPPPRPGAPLAWPVREVTVTGARLGLTPYTDPAGTVLLVPAYELTSDGGETWSVLAVADDALDLAP